MATNLQINDELLERAKRIGGHRTKRETVDQALLEFIQRREQMKVLDLAGTIDFFKDYHPRKGRQRR